MMRLIITNDSKLPRSWRMKGIRVIVSLVDKGNNTYQFLRKTTFANTKFYRKISWDSMIHVVRLVHNCHR